MPDAIPTPPDPDRDRAIDQALDAALDLHGEARSAFLGALRTRDPELASRVERLLAAGAEPDPRLDTGHWRSHPPWESLEGDGTPEVAPGTRVGPWRIVGLLGQGGMAEVHLAERADGLYAQQVAVKFVHALHPAGRRRFEQERRILAALDHPRIARLLDGGSDAAGRPYLVMEYVEGEPIDRYCARTGAGPAERVGLVIAVAEAVEYAHRHLVVHRDLKPSNILVNRAGEVKLLDFGIARLLEEGDAHGAGGAEVGVTAPLARVLTPEYASPEQVRGERATTASDVFQLGILLYELLAGVRPFALDRSSRTSPAEVERIVCQEDPPLPSVAARRAVEGVEGAAGEAGVRRARLLRGDLDTIVMKALAKEPERRYPTVAAMRDDLLRHRQGLPVRARPPTLRYRAARFVARNRVGVGALAMVLLALVGGLGVASWQWAVAAAERERAREARAEAEQVADFLLEVFEVADPEFGGGEEVTARELLARGAGRIDAGTGDPRTTAALMEVMGRAYRNLGLWGEAEPLLVGSVALRREEAHDRAGEAALARGLAELGRLRVDQRRLDEAAALHDEALGVLRRIHAEPHAEVARTLLDRSVVHHLAGELDEAGALAREVLAQRLLLLGETHRDVAEARMHVGRNHLFRLDLDPAEEALEASIAVQRELGGAPDLLLSTAINHLGQVRHNQGRLDEAEALYGEAYGIASGVLGGEHPRAADIRNNQGTVLHARGLHAEAAAVFEEVLAARRASLGPDHPLLAHTLHNLASVYQVLDRYPESEAYFRRALEIREDAYGPRHASVGLTRWGLGHLLRRMGALAASEGEMVLAVAILRESGGDDSPTLGAALLDYGGFLVEQGRAAEAEPLLAEALRVRRVHYAEDDARVVAALERLNEARSALGIPVDGNGGG